MWKYVAIVRDEEGLKTAQTKLDEIDKKANDMKVSEIPEFNEDIIVALEIKSMIKLARLIIQSALLRKESRGAHFRSDYPETNDGEYLKSFILNKNGEVKTVKRGLFD